jgi:endoglucanase
LKVARPRARRPGALAAALALVISLLATAAACAAPLSISVSGNHFVNGAGQTVRLLGVNQTSSEYACVDGYGYDDGHMDAADAAAIASWNADAVRIPLNEDCWLGINGQPNHNEAPGETITREGYRQAIEEYVADLNAHGLYAILDLHWTAPGSKVAEGQQPMPDAGHSPAFWESVAQTFKSDPAVVFDVFNEPYDPTDPRSGEDKEPQDKVSWSCWENGGCDTAAYNGEGAKEATYEVAGMQSLVDAIRSTGATQPVMVGGLNFANDLSEWVEHAPNDPLDQEAASFHNYMGQSCDDAACWNSQIVPVAAVVPVVTGEFDEDDYAESKCTNRTPSDFDGEYMNWADEHGVGYMAWGWIVLEKNEKEREGCSAFYLIEDYGGTPAPPNGILLHEHLLTLPPGDVTPGTPAPGGGIVEKGTASTPAASTPSAPAVGFALLRQSVLPGGSHVAFTLRSSQNCSGTLSGQSVGSYAVTASAHRRHLLLGTVHFTLTAGRAKTVELTLSRAARRLLTARRSLKVRITITLTSTAHRGTLIVRTIIVRAPTRLVGR